MQRDLSRLAEIKVLVPITVVVPTFKEVLNIPVLIDRIRALRDSHAMEIELLFMDDDSRDGSVEAVNSAGFEWCRIVVRLTNRGLSPSVVDGIWEARHPVVVVMDADLSHPPEAIPRMILALDSGQEFVIGSRYVPGGTTDDDWGFLRWLNSKIATLLARPLTSARDPMAGFFAFRKALLSKNTQLNPIGYKIGLELIVKLGVRNVAEIPIHFADRRFGQSKLTIKEQLRYLQHLRRLYIYKYASWSSFAQFLVVGLSGTVVNLSVLTIMLALSVPETAAIIGAIFLSLISNFILNRRFTFSYARRNSVLKQFAGFVSASVAGLIVNLIVTLWIRQNWSAMPVQAAAAAGILSGMLLNFVANRYLVFRVGRTKCE